MSDPPNDLDTLVSILRDTGWSLHVVSDIYQPAGLRFVLEGDRSGHDIVAHADTLPKLLTLAMEEMR